MIKTEPETETRARTTTTSNFSSSSSHQAPSLSTQRSLPTSNLNDTTPNSSAFPVSSNTSNPSNPSNNNNQPPLSQALASFFQSQITTPTSPNNANTNPPFLDFENSRIEIHFHVHPILRPAFPTPVSVSQKVGKRKRGTGRGNRNRGDGNTERKEETGGNRVVGNDCDLDLDLDMDVSEERRSKKKVKLTHEFDTLGGYPVERRGTGAGSVGVKTRSGPRRPRRSNRR
jgi:hypothetical protein